MSSKRVRFSENVKTPKTSDKCRRCKHRNVAPFVKPMYKCDTCKKTFCINCFMWTKHTMCINCYFSAPFNCMLERISLASDLLYKNLSFPAIDT